MLASIDAIAMGHAAARAVRRGAAQRIADDLLAGQVIVPSRARKVRREG
jgi:hypothetical protein